MSLCFRWVGVLTLFVLIAVPLAGQAPPPETKFDVLTDIGLVPGPATCGCVTHPFQTVRLRPGWGYGNGPAAPDTDAPAPRAERQVRGERDGETVANRLTNAESAGAGNPAASFVPGMDLTTGTALERDDVEAAKWFLLAANQGHQNAYIQLGHRYHRGLGLPQSDEAEAYWFYQGSKHGDTLAMSALGSLYAAGRGVPQDWKLAVSWWRKANQYRFVGDAYACGLGVTQSNDLAVREYQKAADAGDMSSAIQLGHMHAGRCAIAPNDQLASNWYDKAAHQGYPEAQVALASLLLQGRADGSPVSAYMWAKLAELRLPDGELRRLAAKQATEATRRLSSPEITSTELLVKNMIATGSAPMNR
jgi:TPR repeat protein